MFGFRKKKSDDAAPEASIETPEAGESLSAPKAEEIVTSPAVEVVSEPASPAGVSSVLAADVSEIVVPPRQSPSVIMEEFCQEVDRQEDRLYGIALFFECISLLHAGQAGVLDTSRKQFRNIIVAGHASIAQARALADKAKQDPSSIDSIRAFRFTFCEGHPNPLGLAARADALLKAYRRLYPDRPADKPFTEDETYRLLDAASGILSPVLNEP